MKMHNGKRWILLLLPLFLLPAVAWWFWPHPREVVYSLYRERGRSRILADLEGYQVKSSDHVDVYYQDADKNVVDWVLQTTEKVYKPVADSVGYQPTERVPVIIYPNRDELRQAFGWSNGESAMGVYWSGTVRLLSPNVWISERKEKDKKKVFDKLNPIAHELTHYMLDYLTNGNYPRWFTEGLAQRVEYKLTGYLWIESDSSLDQDLYTLDDLDNRFDELHNQPLAYRESFLLVDYMAKQHGEDCLADLIRRLGEGTGFQDAVHEAVGVSMPALYSDWQDWVHSHLKELDAAG